MKASYESLIRDISRYGVTESVKKHQKIRDRYVDLKNYIEDEC
jgi:hypothetical protein